MEIRQFDKMALSDQGDYLQALVEGAQRVLIAEGKHDDAAKIARLFAEIPAGDRDPIGLTELEINIARARVTDAYNSAKDPHAHRIEVEDAMAVTLHKNGIELPDSFFTVTKNFRPKLSAAKREKRK